MSSIQTSDNSESMKYGFWTRSTQLILVTQYIFVLITIGTMILAIPSVMDYFGVDSDPALIVFPLMAYPPLTASIVFLLYIIRKLNEKRIGKIDECGEYIKLYDWENKNSTNIEIIRKISIGLVILVTGLPWIFGIAIAPGPESLLFSPMNMITLTFVLSFLCVWMSYGISIGNMRVILHIYFLLIVNSAICTVSVIIAEDELVLPILLSYQILALVLIVGRWYFFRIVSNKMEK